MVCYGQIGLFIVDGDPNLAEDVNDRIPTQKAVKAYVDSAITMLPMLTRATGPVTVNLPAATGSKLTQYIKNIGPGTVTVMPNGSDTIDGAASYLMTFQYEGHIFVDGAAGKWDVIA
jgi:hypothetical protein